MIHISPLKPIVFIICFIFSVQVNAASKLKLHGAVDGGGGKVVVCRNSDTQINNVELLDLWEAKTLYDTTPRDLAPDLAGSVQIAIQALKNSYHLKMSMGLGEGRHCEDQDCLVMLMNDTAHLFFTDNNRLKRLRGVELTLTDDSYELAKPKNCSIEQVVNYRPDGKILMDEDLFEKMSMKDQTALIVHEGYYSFLRSFMSEEKNSIRTRRAIGFILSGRVFQLQSQPEFGTHLFCHANGVPYSPTNIFIYEDPKFKKENCLSPYVEDINGTKLIGEPQPLIWFNFGNKSKEALFSGICDHEGFLGSIRFSGNGPVEFDHRIGISCLCKQGKTQIFVTQEMPGEPLKTTELNCISRIQ
jgi:hypothetical protein